MGVLDTSTVQNLRGAEIIKHVLVEKHRRLGASQSHSMQIIKQMVSQKRCQEKAFQFHLHGDSSSKKNQNVNLKIASFWLIEYNKQGFGDLPRITHHCHPELSDSTCVPGWVLRCL